MITNTKEKLIHSIEKLIEHIVFIEKVQQGLNDIIKGKINNKKQAKQKLSKWLK